MLLSDWAHELLVSLLHVERRTEPYWRSYANTLLREPSAALLQALINLQRRRHDGPLAAEQILPGEEQALDSIVSEMRSYVARTYVPGEVQRVAGTKLHGLVRAEVTIRDDIPAELRRGVFREPRMFPAWIRFAGPGPGSPPDIEDIGFLTMSVKLMGVPGPKLLDDEKHTQDFLSVCTPTFVTPDVIANARLHRQLLRRTPLWYFFDPRQLHVLDLLMQGLWTETQTSPLECSYFSCVPYLLGADRAMQFSFQPRTQQRSRIEGLPDRPSDNYLRDNLIATLSKQDVLFDMRVQLQTDAHAMPIENAAVRWPEALSPHVPVATIRIPKQKLDSPALQRFAATLSFNPWHCIPEHRPLGNMNRARKRIYDEMMRLRAAKNRTPHPEPTGRETFDEAPPAQPQPPFQQVWASSGPSTAGN
ncbi:MAG TPA: catalase family protein [Polyangiales bacterium]|jgi:hypothetical protein|nr:catalase family protein [Polyangiales bacterium]